MNTRALIAAAFATAAAASIASADVVTVKYTGSGKGQNVKITLNGNSSDVFAGQLKHQISDATGFNSYLNGIWTTFCTDLTEYVSGSNKTFNLVTIDQLMAPRPNAADKANALRALFAAGGAASIDPGASNDQSTAFQLAVWEVITDFDPTKVNNGLSLTGGGFSAKKTNGSALASSVTNIVSGYLTAAANITTEDGSLIGIMRSGNQDQIIKVPAPGAVALAGLGGGLIMGRKRRKA